MFNKKLIIKVLAIVCVLSLLPVSAVMAASPSKAVPLKHGTKGAIMNLQKSNHGKLISPLTTNWGNGGYTELNTYDMGGYVEEADWHLHSTDYLITYVSVTTTFDDGASYNQSYNAYPSYDQYNAVQHQFSSGGYHSATVTGWGYKDFGLIDFTIIPTTDGTYLY